MSLKEYVLIISLALSLLAIGHVFYRLFFKYRSGIKGKISNNLRTRFFSITLGMIASVAILFIVHILLEFIPKSSELTGIMKDETYSYLIKTLFAVIVTAVFVLVFDIE
ncbi:MAG TPA: hypothetical protein VNW06_07970, partial [Cytophagaceae bacterium]|nr:hypothetical protein [Cytophagaceae bacterium]